MIHFVRSSVFVLALLLLSGIAFPQVVEGTFAIKNRQTGMVLRIMDAKKADKTPLVAYAPVNWKCVTWDFKHVDGQSYQLRNLFTNKTFQAQSAAPAEGVALEQQPLVLNEAKQQYEFIPIEKGVYLIRLRGTELYITPSDENGTANTRIVLAKKNGSKLQQWTLYEQHPDM